MKAGGAAGLRGAASAALGMAVLSLAGCGGSAGAASTPGSAGAAHAAPAAAVGIQVQPLARGTVPSLPAGTLYVDVLEVTEQEHEAMMQSGMMMHPHGVGFEYTVSGVHTVPTAGGGSRGIPAGHASFIGPDIVPNIMSPNASDWYFIAIRPVAQRHAFPNTTVLFETPDLPQLPAGAVSEDLRRLTIAAGGRTQAHTHGGLEVIIVMQGTMSLHRAGAAPRSIVKGEGAYVPPSTPLQIYNNGTSSAKALVFLATPPGTPFQTQLRNPV